MSVKATSVRASNLSYWLLVGFLIILWIAGGASRADVLGQAVVRFFAWAIVAVAIFWLPSTNWRAIKEPAAILALAALLVALQLIPLPPSIWTDLPGREVFVQAAALTDSEQPWRPLSISPNGTGNALASLVVPAAVLLLVANLSRQHHKRISVLILGLAIAGTFIGALQFSEASFVNPLVNTAPGTVTGTFSNRNHFALFLAIGCVLALTLAFDSKVGHWKLWCVFGIFILFILTILATGSRSGALLALLAILFGGLAVRQKVVSQFKLLPRKAVIGLVVTALGLTAASIWASITLGRAASVQRAVTMDTDADLRWQIWPVLIDMIGYYAPVGSGFGTFEPAFRMHEPDSMLNPLYVNLGHNDWLQILLEGGLAGGILFVGALAWFLKRSLAVFSKTVDKGQQYLQSFGRAGSIIVLLILIAGITDYAARTPIIMAMLVIAAFWLSEGRLRVSHK